MNVFSQFTGRDLVCANCNGPVSEGRCATCRESRRQLERSPWSPQVWSAFLVALVATVLALLVLSLADHAFA